MQNTNINTINSNIDRICQQLDGAARHSEQNPNTNVFSGRGQILGGNQEVNMLEARERYYGFRSSIIEQNTLTDSSNSTTFTSNSIPSNSSEIITNRVLQSDINSVTNGRFFQDVNILSIQTSPVINGSNLTEVLLNEMRTAPPVMHNSLTFSGRNSLLQLQEAISNTATLHLNQLDINSLQQLQNTVMSHMNLMGGVNNAVVQAASVYNPLFHSTSNHFSGMTIILKLFSNKVLVILEKLLLSDITLDAAIIVVFFLVKFSGLFISVLGLNYFINENNIMGIFQDLRTSISTILGTIRTSFSRAREIMDEITRSTRLSITHNFNLIRNQLNLIRERAIRENRDATIQGWISNYFNRIGFVLLTGVGVLIIGGIIYYAGPSFILTLGGVTITVIHDLGASIVSRLSNLVSNTHIQRVVISTAEIAAIAATRAFNANVNRLHRNLDGIIKYLLDHNY